MNEPDSDRYLDHDISRFIESVPQEKKSFSHDVK